MEAIFLENFEDAEDVFNNFGTSKKDKKDVDILFAWYGYGDYCGAAFVLFEKEGELFEVNGSHCSCMGLEDQWEPDKTSKKELMFRIEEGTLGESDSCEGSEFAEDLKKILENYS